MTLTAHDLPPGNEPADPTDQQARIVIPIIHTTDGDRTALYRVFNAAEHLLYVGISKDPSKRFDAHRTSKPWWHEADHAELLWYDTRKEAALAEYRAIQDERPRYNIAEVAGGRTAARARRDLWPEVVTDPDRVAEQRAKLDAEVRTYRLAEIRKEQFLTQSNIAEVLGVSRNAISILERGELDHVALRMISAYVEALGGEFQLFADFGDRQIPIQ